MSVPLPPRLWEIIERRFPFSTLGKSGHRAAGTEIRRTAWWARELSHIKQSQLVIKGAGK